MRGTTGADFEGTGRISRGGGVGLGCCFGWGGDDSHKERLIMIKGPFCFVYSDENAKAPKYAIGLQYMNGERKGSSVMVQTNFGDLQYEVHFSDDETAKKFTSTLRKQASSAQAEEVRKKLGHGGLLNKRASVRYAETVALQKVKDQPEKPISTTEVMDTFNAVPQHY